MPRKKVKLPATFSALLNDVRNTSAVRTEGLTMFRHIHLRYGHVPTSLTVYEAIDVLTRDGVPRRYALALISLAQRGCLQNRTISLYAQDGAETFVSAIAGILRVEL